MRALLLAALLSAGPALAATPTPEAMTKKEQGDARRDAGDAAGALAAYREALRLSPGYVEAWEEIGKVHFGARRYSEAADAFQRATEIDGSYANNWYNLSLAARRAGDDGLAREGLRRYLELRPSDHEARLRFADVLRALGERGTARREYEAVAAAAEARQAPPALGEKARAAIASLQADEAGAPPRVTIVPLAPSAPEAAAPASSPAPPPPSSPASPSPAAAAATQAAPAPLAVSAGFAQPAGAAPPAAAPAASTSSPRPAAEPVTPPSPALLDKLALGDRLQASGDHRGALFAYQDAVYLDPRHAVARVKLGRAYWNLRYVGQAEEQWQQATQLAPNDPSIARMIEEARKAPRPAVPGLEPSNGTSGGPAPASGAAAGQGPRVYRIAPDPAGAPAPPTAAAPYGSPTPGYGAPPAAPPQPAYGQPPYPAQGAPAYAPPGPSYPQPAPQYAPQPPGYGQPAYPPQGAPAYAAPAPAYPQPGYAQPQYAPSVQPQYAPPGWGPPGVPAQPAHGAQGLPGGAAPLPAPEPPPAQPAPAAAAAAQRYRSAINLYIQRNYLAAVAELDAAITLDPGLAVAYTARGSAKFGLGRYREAAADYQAALDLDASRAEPIWGLAESQRMLKDPAAPETYRRYASSIAADVNEERRDKARRWAAELSRPSGSAPP